MKLNKATIPVAVIGMGCHYPGADSPAKLWVNILSRRRQFRRIPACRLPLEAYYHEDRKSIDRTYARMAAVIDGFTFDWAARRIPRLAYQSTDIVHWLALETALQAIADAGFKKETLPGRRTGVIVGNSLTGEQSRSYNLRLRWPYIRKSFLTIAHQRKMASDEIQAMENELEASFKSAFPPTNEDTLAGGLSNTIAGRICNYLDLDGGGYTVDGACSSSLLAIATAATKLATGTLDLALAGGVDISLDPFEMVGFSKAGALTSGEMTVYDNRASGFLPGEGCGFVVLKRFDDAKKDNNSIYAVIRGWGISSDGSHAAITAPSVQGQSLALRRAYEHAAYGVDRLHFIEGHGTGTSVGDRVELEAIGAVQNGNHSEESSSHRLCGITSLKSILGHTKAASGVGGFIKTVISVNRRICPPIANCRYPNPAFEASARHLFPVQIGRHLPAAEVIRAGVSAMGFGGINSHVTLESAGPPDPKFAPAIDERALMAASQENELFVLSAETFSTLLLKCQTLEKSADGISYAEMTDLAAALGRQADSKQPLRAAFIAGKPDALIEKLSKLKTIIETHPPKAGQTYMDPMEKIWLGRVDSEPKVGFLFPGQGSQKLNMARVLVERFEWARERVQRADRLADEFGAERLSRIMFPPTDQARDADQVNSWSHALSLTANAQPAICLASILWCRFLRELGVTPSVVGGHSIGEASAFYAAGAFDEQTLLRFAYQRGKAMHTRQKDSGAMLSMRCTRSQVDDLLKKVTDGYAALANINAPSQMVVAGELKAIEQLTDLAKTANVPAQRLPVSNAFHCRLTSRAAQKLSRLTILPASVSDLPVRIFSSVKGQAEISAGHDLHSHFVRQVTTGVNFVGLVENIAKHSDILIEVGPGRVLCGLVDAIIPDGRISCLPVESSPFTSDDLNRLLAQLYVSGQTIDWDVLYANRQVESFIPPADRVFISNPCENLPVVDAAASSGDRTTEPLQPAAPPLDLPGLSQATLQSYLQTRGQFLSDLIKIDMQHSLADDSPEKHDTSAPLLSDESSSVSHATVGNRTDGSDEETLYAMVEETTGFPKETLTRALRLLDDLNLDSIKSGDLIVRYLEKYGLSGEIDTARWTNASLGEIVDLAAQRHLDNARLAGKDDHLSSSDILKVLIDQIASATHRMPTDIPDDAQMGPDLHLDVEQLQPILDAASKALGLDLNLDLPQLLGRSAAQIADIFSRMINVGTMTHPLSKIKLPQTAVREMRVDIIESERPELPAWFGKRAEDKWDNARVLIIADKLDDTLGQDLRDQLLRLGAKVRVATFGLVQEKTFSATIDRFSHFIALLPRLAIERTITEKRLMRIIRRLSFAAVPPPASHGPRRRNCIVFVQFGGGYFGTHSDAVFLDQCCATALAKSVYLERDDLKMRVIDFDSRTDTALIAAKTILEIEGPQDFVEAGYDRDLTRRTAVANVIEPVQYTPDLLSWSAEDVILVTGGAKGITATCALALAWAIGAKMALVGSTPLKVFESDDRDHDSIHQLLRRYEKQGLTARYYSCDVCNRNAVARTIKLIQNEMGPITGVIHGAGHNLPRRFYQVSPEDALKEVGPKVVGMLNLLAELGKQPPKRIVGLTSIIGITGMQGNGWYAFSNEALDLILRRFAARHPKTRTLSVAYSIWRDEGMGARLGSVKALSKKGIDAIPTDQGVQRFVRLFLSKPGTHQVLVTARILQMDTLGKPAMLPFKGARFLEKRVHFIPGFESAFLVHLTLDEDLYLQDHCFNDSYLFPTVFGLEAMAQVAASLTGISELNGVRIEDLLLRRPIIVDPEKGADIIIWAQSEERVAIDDKLSVKTGIFRVGADSDAASFSATFIMDAMDPSDEKQIDIPSETLEINPSTDLYRKTLLFQGPRFQRIRNVHQLDREGDASGIVMLSTAPPDPNSATRAFASPENQSFLLGDPFLRDCLLQSAALLVPQDTSLPVSIRNWDICTQTHASPGQEQRFVRNRLQRIQDQDIETVVDSLDASGRVLERLAGYHLKILKHHDDYPRVADLLRPDDRDTRQLQERSADFSDRLHLKTPDVYVSFIPGLHDLPMDQRRELERSFLLRTLENWAVANDADFSRILLQWNPSGKPVAGIGDKTLDISLSHDNQYCIVTIGSCDLGCDLAPVSHRTADQWTGLLGPFASKVVDAKLTGEELDRRGTALWAAREVLQKLDVQETISIEIEASVNDSILFVCTTDKGVIKILTFIVTLTRGKEKIVAFSVTEPSVATAAGRPQRIDYKGYETLLDGQQYQIMEGGPQGQVVFVYRFPVTFMPAGQLSRHVYYSHYFFWAGTVRETSAWPVLKQIADQFSTGQWGGVTNHADLKILGEATTQDLIEARLWASGNGGPHDSVLDLTFDFRKVLPDGGYERLAWLEQQTTWVRIFDHGAAKVAPYPEYYGSFLAEMLPRFDAPNLPEPIAEPLHFLHTNGNERHLYQAPAGPEVKPILHAQLMDTTLEDANIVGNIYFANYYAWQGRVRDNYFYTLIPDYFRGTGEKGELICLNCRVDHLREAMPFDRIEVRMALKSLKECRASLHFEYFKLGSNGDAPLKLATGRQEIVWVHRDAMKKPVVSPFPSAISEALQTTIAEQA